MNSISVLDLKKDAAVRVSTRTRGGVILNCLFYVRGEILLFFRFFIGTQH